MAKESHFHCEFRLKLQNYRKFVRFSVSGVVPIQRGAETVDQMLISFDRCNNKKAVRENVGNEH